VRQLAGSIPDWDTIAEQTAVVYREAAKVRSNSVKDTRRMNARPLTGSP
jgi:hypothetical protein